MKLLMAVSFAGMFNVYVVLTVLPLYVVELGGSAFHAGLMSGVGLLSAVLFRFVFGPMTDERGRRLPLIIGNVVFMLAPIGFWLANSVSGLIFMRALQAIGPAAYLGAVSALAVDLSPPSLKATGLGVVGIFKSLGAAVGPPVAISVAAAYGFPAVFSLCIFFGAVGVVGSILLTDDRHRAAVGDARDRGAPEGGADAAVTDSASLSPPKNNPWLAVLSTRSSRFAALTVAVVATAQGAIVTFVPLYGEDVGVTHHGTYLALLSTAGMIGGLVAGALSDRLGRVRTLVPTLFLFSVGVAALVAFKSPWMALVSAMLAGGGFTGNLIILGSMMAENSSERHTGVVFHLQEGAVDIGMGIGAFLLGLATEPLGYPAGFLGIGVGCALWGLFVAMRSNRS